MLCALEQIMSLLNTTCFPKGNQWCLLSGVIGVMGSLKQAPTINSVSAVFWIL